jgi:hypothetical protein
MDDNLEFLENKSHVLPWAVQTLEPTNLLHVQFVLQGPFFYNTVRFIYCSNVINLWIFIVQNFSSSRGPYLYCFASVWDHGSK